MEEIIKTLLLEGIDEDTIHRVLDVIEEEYEVVSERNKENRVAKRDWELSTGKGNTKKLETREKAIRWNEKAGSPVMTFDSKEVLGNENREELGRDKRLVSISGPDRFPYSVKHLADKQKLENSQRGTRKDKYSRVEDELNNKIK